MKKFILSIFVVFAAAVFSCVSAQVPPPGAGDKDLRDNNIRMRSNELERVKRNANKPKTGESSSPMNSEIDTKFPEIKEDYESIQLSQDAIIKAYSTGEKIDYKQIETSAEAINKSAKRLDSNLFSPKPEKDKSKKDEDQKTKSVKDLIVELDNAIGSFVSSAMFQNLRVVDPAVAQKAQLDLTNILEISKMLSKEAIKMK
jgi:hypothetical protein